MADNSGSEKGNNRAVGADLQFTPFVPEEQVFQRIPLCRYLSDLSALFESDDGGDASGEKREDLKEKS